jgi:hypothetical protein
VFLGTGTAGAYHAGVLRALLEAGVRLDLVAGRGIGAVSAFFAASDAGVKLWDEAGLWTDPATKRLYRLRPLWRWLAACLVAALMAMALPLVFALAIGAAYPVMFLVQLAAPQAAAGLLAGYRDWLAFLLSKDLLSSIVPRFATAGLFAAALSVALIWLVGIVRPSPRRRLRGGLWGAALGAPVDAARAVEWATRGFWEFIRGATTIAQPDAPDLGRRFAELVSDSLGQPGYRELLLLAHDVDARRDVVCALLDESHRAAFVEGDPDGRRADRSRDLLDLAGTGREHVIDALAGALAVPMVCEPHRVRFAPEGSWRGETHRLCDRPGAVTRLFEEVALAGATQLIVVSAVAGSAGPHALTAVRPGLRARAGEVIASAEAAALEEASSATAHRFWGIHRIAPAHNPLGPFDLGGGYDDRSDRPFALRELVSRGYEDAYRQFIEPVVGASGEAMQTATVIPDPAEDLPLRS